MSLPFSPFSLPRSPSGLPNRGFITKPTAETRSEKCETGTVGATASPLFIKRRMVAFNPIVNRRMLGRWDASPSPANPFPFHPG